MLWHKGVGSLNLHSSFGNKSHIWTPTNLSWTGQIFLLSQATLKANKRRAAACTQHCQTPQNGAFPSRSNMKTQLVTTHYAQSNFQPFSFLLINLLIKPYRGTAWTWPWPQRHDLHCPALTHRRCCFYLNSQVHRQYSEQFTPWDTHALEWRRYEDCSRSAGTERQNWRNRRQDHYKIEQRIWQFEIWIDLNWMQNKHTKLSCTTNLFLQRKMKKKKRQKKTKPDGLRRRLPGFALDAPLMLWITRDTWYTLSCRKLPRVGRTWEHNDVCLLAPSTIFRGVLLTNKLTHCQVRYNKACPCGSRSLVSTNRLEVKPADLNWKIRVLILYSF